MTSVAASLAELAGAACTTSLTVLEWSHQRPHTQEEIAAVASFQRYVVIYIFVCKSCFLSDM